MHLGFKIYVVIEGGVQYHKQVEHKSESVDLDYVNF